LTADRIQCEDTAVPRKRSISILVSALVSAALLALLFSSVPIRDLLETLTSLFLPALAAYFLLSLAATALKAGRARWLLAPLPVSWKDILIVSFIRNAFEDLLPARVGSLSYVLVLTRSMGVSFEAAASTFVVMFVFDFLTLPPFVIAAFLFARTAAGNLRTPLILGLALAYLGLNLLLVWKIVPVSKWLTGVYRRVVRLLGWEKAPRALRSIEKLDETVGAIAGIQSRAIVLPLFLLSLLIRLLKYLSLSALLFAVLHHRGFALADLPPWKIVLAITAAEFTSVLPVKGIADFGTWESAWVLAFALLGFDRTIAVLSGFSLHLVANLFEYALAALAMLALSLRPRHR